LHNWKFDGNDGSSFKQGKYRNRKFNYAKILITLSHDSFLNEDTKTCITANLPITIQEVDRRNFTHSVTVTVSKTPKHKEMASKVALV